MRILISSTYCALAPDDVSLLLSEEVLKSTPPRPILGAGAADTAVEAANREPNVNPPPPPRVVGPKPATPSKHIHYNTVQ